MVVVRLLLVMSWGGSFCQLAFVKWGVSECITW